MAIYHFSGQYHGLVCENPLCEELFLPKEHVRSHDGRHFCDLLCEHQANEEDALEEGVMRILARG